MPPLTLPNPSSAATVATLGASEAIQLFAERARAALPGFALTTDNCRAVAQVCTRLDGVPLALELAAARLNVLGPDEVAARMDDRFGLLVSGSRTAPPRQQTLRGTLDWSYDLLPACERQLLDRLVVFASDWDLEAAEAGVLGRGQVGAGSSTF